MSLADARRFAACTEGWYSREYGVHHDSDEIPYNVNRQTPSLDLPSSMMEQREAPVLTFHQFDPSTNLKKQ